MIKISVLLICQNSEKTIARTLDSCKKFDEVVVIDGGSTDQTPAIAKSYANVKFVHHPWEGFIPQRNFSITQASHDWCFMIDSDEACTPDLVSELYRLAEQVELENLSLLLFRVMRTEYFLGEPIEYGFGKSNYQERLFRKGRVTYGGGVHHLHLIDGVHVQEHHPLVANLDSRFRVLHDHRYGLEEWLKKLPRFSTLIAAEKFQSGKRSSVFVVLVSFIGTFFQIWWKSRKEGKRGIVMAFSEAIYRTTVKLLIYEKGEIGFSKK